MGMSIVFPSAEVGPPIMFPVDPLLMPIALSGITVVDVTVFLEITLLSESSIPIWKAMLSVKSLSTKDDAVEAVRQSVSIARYGGHTNIQVTAGLVRIDANCCPR